jgi:hypothetical protein
VDRILEAARRPGAGAFLSLAAVVALLVVLAIALRRRLASPSRKQRPA